MIEVFERAKTFIRSIFCIVQLRCSIFLINVVYCFRYLLQYKRDNDNNREEKTDDYRKKVQDQINLFFKSLELRNTGYTVSFFQDELNEIITDINFDNCQIKNLLINYFSEDMFH